MYLILVYDIKQECAGAKIQRKVFKICKRYLIHIQNSVFEGELSIAQFEMLKNEISSVIRKDLDSCIIFSNRNSKWMKKEFLTQEIDHQTQFL